MNLNILKLKEVDSTNRYALDNFAELADNTLIIADFQSAGRGRRGRQWISPSGMNLYATYIVKDLKFPIERVLWCGGLAALITITEYAPEADVWLKWPNDICCSSDRCGGYCKIAGLLAEAWTPFGSNQIGGVVAGIGVNLNMPPDMLAEIDQPAASLFAETGRKVDVAEFAEKLLCNLMKMRQVAEDDPEIFFEIWSSSNGLIGREITLKIDDKTSFTGVVQGVTPNGAIEIKDCNGDVNTFMTGDIVKKEIV